MGEIIGAGLVSHVPTIMLSEEIRYELNEGKEISLVPGLHRLRSEIFETLKPDVVIVFDTHWHTLVEYAVTSNPRREGLFTSDELPRGMSQIPYNLKGDPELAIAIASEASALGVRTSAISDPYLPIRYATVNIAHYLQYADEAWMSISCPMTAGEKENLIVGQAIAKAVADSGKRVILLASGSMSHTFYPFSELGKHESSDPVHIFTPEAREADYLRLNWFKEGNHAAVIDNMDSYYQHHPEARFSHYLMMIGALGAHQCKAKGRQFSDYENSVGTSQVHVWFDRPENGWTG